MDTLTSPQIETQGGVLRFRLPQPSRGFGGGHRKPVTRFSNRSRRNLMTKFASTDWQTLIERQIPVLFLTFTLTPEFWSNPRAAYLGVAAMERWFRTLPGFLGGCVRKEYGAKRGALHYHVILLGVAQVDVNELRVRWSKAMRYRPELGKPEYLRVDAQRAENPDRVAKYLCKYMAKAAWEGAIIEDPQKPVSFPLCPRGNKLKAAKESDRKFETLKSSYLHQDFSSSDSSDDVDPSTPSEFVSPTVAAIAEYHSALYQLKSGIQGSRRLRLEAVVSSYLAAHPARPKKTDPARAAAGAPVGLGVPAEATAGPAPAVALSKAQNATGGQSGEEGGSHTGTRYWSFFGDWPFAPLEILNVSTLGDADSDLTPRNLAARVRRLFRRWRVATERQTIKRTLAGDGVVGGFRYSVASAEIQAAFHEFIQRETDKRTAIFRRSRLQWAKAPYGFTLFMAPDVMSRMVAAASIGQQLSGVYCYESN